MKQTLSNKNQQNKKRYKSLDNFYNPQSCLNKNLKSNINLEYVELKINELSHKIIDL